MSDISSPLWLKATFISSNSLFGDNGVATFISSNSLFGDNGVTCTVEELRIPWVK